ncbi:MAG: circadian clock KaiB family protein [Gammaproteobacteria bacterium]
MSGEHVLRLYVAGKTARAEQAIADLKRLCKQELGSQYRVEVIDVRDDPSAAERQKILATPTVIKELPLPVRRVIGDLSQTERVLVGLDLVRVDADGMSDSA